MALSGEKDATVVSRLLVVVVVISERNSLRR